MPVIAMGMQGPGVLMNYQSVGRLFRKARRHAGMSQFDVAQAMGCSRAQVDNIEVARQRAPVYRLEAFAKAVGLRLVIQVVPRTTKSINVRTTSEMVELVDHVSQLEETDRELLIRMAELLPSLPQNIRGTLRGIVTLWSDRYAAETGVRSDTA